MSKFNVKLSITTEPNFLVSSMEVASIHAKSLTLAQLRDMIDYHIKVLEESSKPAIQVEEKEES